MMKMLNFGMIGDIAGDLNRFSVKLERATSAAINETVSGVQTDLRRDTEEAGLGKKVSNAWRKAVYPKGQASMNAAGSVWSNAPHIIDGYSKGGTIRARNSRYLAVPLPQAQKLMRVRGKSGNSRRRITPQLFEKVTGLKLVVIQRPGKNPLLVARGVRITKSGSVRRLTVRKATKTMGERVMLSGLAEAPMFVLVPSAQLKIRIDPLTTANKRSARINTLINQKMKN